MIECNNMEHGFIIAEMLHRSYDPEMDRIISHSDDKGRFLGGILYEGYTGSCINAHQASLSKHWLSRDMLWAMFDYPFNQLNCFKLLGVISSARADLLAFNTKLGFKVEHAIHGGYPEGDMLIMSMTRDECKWLNIKPRTIQSYPGGNIEETP